MQSQVKLGRFAGIEIGLHYSWFIIAILIAFSLAAHFQSINSNWSHGVVWTAAVITSILFFGALLLHELAHSMVAKSNGLRVRAITLFALGGVSQIESDAPSAKLEFWIAIVGPVTSLVLGSVFVLLAWVAGWVPKSEPSTPLTAVLLWLGYINLALAAFNMIPGYPLDGGRVLRSILWWISGNADRATRWSSQIGQAVGFLFMAYGLFSFLVGANFGGLWMAFIGWFLLDAARSTYISVGLMADLRGRTVADLMERDCQTVEGYLSLRDFVDEYLLHTANRCFIVAFNGQPVGFVTPKEIRNVPRDAWPQTSVQSVMLPLNKARTVSPETPAIEAIQILNRESVTHLAVVSDGKLRGVFSHAQVLRFLQLHHGLPAEPQHKLAA